MSGIWALGLNLVMVGLSQLAGFLTLPGNVAAFLLGSVIALTTGWWGWCLLLAFLVSSSLLTSRNQRIRGAKRSGTAKGARRTPVQVVANGLPMALFGVLFWLTGWSPWLAAAGAAIASCNADTWATELGTLWRGRPVSLRSFQRVSPGQSGAVSVPGTLASAGGALLIALVALLPLPMGWEGGARLALSRIAWIGFGGFLGCFADSLLGAWVQVLYRKDDGTLSESKPQNGQRWKRVRGWPWVENNVVNFTSSLLAGIIVALAAME
ncbi:MAG TPA: DUF92 domain-containing protein [Thermotogota bacterium]|mgnify:CR=1 FL=1|nr:DUF92 domain-containing protein [Thermotogota bacterium]HRW93244.1 DUF92 domain-containing protein [Thermotogota bacterium]